MASPNIKREVLKICNMGIWRTADVLWERKAHTSANSLHRLEYVYTYMDIYIYAYINIHTYMYIYVNLYIYIYIYISVYVFEYTYLHMYIYVCVCVWIYLFSSKVSIRVIWGITQVTVTSSIRPLKNFYLSQLYIICLTAISWKFVLLLLHVALFAASTWHSKRNYPKDLMAWIWDHCAF